MEEQEIWKDIPGYEGSYQVSNMGNVKSLERIVIKRGFDIRLKERILIPQRRASITGFYRKNNIIPTNPPRQYYFLQLSSNNKYLNHNIHILVAISFLGYNHDPKNRKIVIDHIDNNPLNNRLDNLRIITQRENLSNRGGTSKYVGVSWNSRNNRWQAEITIDGKRKYIGVFVDEYDAHIAYQKEKEMISILEEHLIKN